MCLACAYLSVTGVVLVQLSVLSVGQSLCLFVHLFVSRSLSVSLCVALCLCPISIYALYPPPMGRSCVIGLSSLAWWQPIIISPSGFINMR